MIILTKENMASNYTWGWSPLNDFFVGLILNGTDLTDNKLKLSIDIECSKLLAPHLNNPKDVVYLDFQILGDDDDGHIIINAKNILTALWLIGMIPNDSEGTLASNKLVIDDGEIIYDKKKEILIFKRK
jgi:hypothetical protein